MIILTKDTKSLIVPKGIGDGQLYPGEGGGASFPDAPKDGNTYGRKDGSWSKIEGAGGGIEEAPEDGSTYGRNTGKWEKIEVPEIDAYTKAEADDKFALKGEGGGGIPEPEELGYFVRRYGRWVNLEHTGYLKTAEAFENFVSEYDYRQQNGRLPGIYCDNSGNLNVNAYGLLNELVAHYENYGWSRPYPIFMPSVYQGQNEYRGIGYVTGIYPFIEPRTSKEGIVIYGEVPVANGDIYVGTKIAPDTIWYQGKWIVFDTDEGIITEKITFEPLGGEMLANDVFIAKELSDIAINEEGTTNIDIRKLKDSGNFDINLHYTKYGSKRKSFKPLCSYSDYSRTTQFIECVYTDYTYIYKFRFSYDEHTPEDRRWMLIEKKEL